MTVLRSIALVLGIIGLVSLAGCHTTRLGRAIGYPAPQHHAP